MSDGAASGPAGGTRDATGTRRHRGRTAHLAGDAAEKAVAILYERCGAEVIETRWRGKSGEIDLILLQAGVCVFCEVKAARRLSDAVERLRPAQIRRIHAAASEYLVNRPAGQMSEVRFDLAAVDGTGRAEIFQNAFGHF